MARNQWFMPIANSPKDSTHGPGSLSQFTHSKSAGKMEETFASRLKALLAQRKLMLKQVAEAVSVSPSAVHKWTRGGEI
jgi:predicted XRE-type DNA-binding protein